MSRRSSMPTGAIGWYEKVNHQTGRVVKVYQFAPGTRKSVPPGMGTVQTHRRAHRERGSFLPTGEETSANLRRTVAANTNTQRPLWLGPYRSVPSYLDGSLVGDYGWDSAGLRSEPESLATNRELELIHARWAMAGSLGCLAPELLSTFGGVSFQEPVWYSAGSQILQPDGLDYLGNPALIHAQSILAVLFFQVLLMGLAEGYRVSGGPLGQPGSPLYPGDALDPLGFGEDSSTLSELQLKEIKNGLLAMVAMLGMYVQSCTTGKGPVANWSEHIASPTAANGLAYATKLAPSLLA